MKTHRHSCAKCGREWTCERRGMDEETEAACAHPYSKSSLCDQCFNDLEPQVSTEEEHEELMRSLRLSRRMIRPKPRVSWVYLLRISRKV